MASDARQHFVGNQAISLGNGEAEMQIEYSTSITALSFFVPIIVLLLAFLAVGADNRVYWWRVTLGGVLAGCAICGMHYMGNASIDNYVCVYEVGNVVGAALIAAIASVVALSIFFVFRAAWRNSWWRRLLAAVILATAVSGMHWCAAVGTQYQLKALKDEMNYQASRNVTVGVVIVLVSLPLAALEPSHLTGTVGRRLSGSRWNGRLHHTGQTAACQQGPTGYCGGGGI